MKKTLIALAVLGVTAGVAHAQSNVTIYGIVDQGFVKATGDKLTMDENINNRLGFRGVEDLGGGLKATFNLEQRFALNNGRESADGLFQGAANIGLAGSFGAVRFGRLNEVSTESLRTLDPFNQFGIAGMLETPLRGQAGEGRLSYTTRYDSPNMAGFSVGATYTLRNQDESATEYGASLIPDASPGDTVGYDATGTTDASDGYAVGVKYKNGPIAALANYNRAVNSNDSYNWNLGAAYAFGPATVSAAYEQSNLKYVVGSPDAELKTALVGLSYKIGSGVAKAAYSHMKGNDFAVGDFTDKKIALGYTHNLSKRTAVYLDLARTSYDENSVFIDGEDDVNAVALGVTHRF